MQRQTQKRVIDLIESPELHDWYLKDPDRLTERNYTKIVTGAPIDLSEKLALLEQLRHDCGKQERNRLDNLIDYLNDGMEVLSHAGENDTFLLISPIEVSMKNGSRRLEGPYPAKTWEEARKACKAYTRGTTISENERMHRYWVIKLYDLKTPSLYDGCRSAIYTYVADTYGNIQYFEANRCQYEEKICSLDLIDAFFGSAFNLNLPVPWKAGDTLKIDCRPYEPGPLFCVLTNVSDDLFGMQCVYSVGKKVECGAIKRGSYYWPKRNVNQFVSPFYRARLWNGPLPKELRKLEQYRKHSIEVRERDRKFGAERARVRDIIKRNHAVDDY